MARKSKNEVVSFSSLEIGPGLLQRKDTAKYQSGLRRARNVLGLVGGGFYNRPGFQFCGPLQDEAKTATPIPFQFSVGQSYALEFGDLTMRVLYKGGYITENALIVSDISNTFPAVVTAQAHGYATGEDVYFADIQGMTEINGVTARITVIDADTFSLNGVDATGWGEFTESLGGVLGDALGGVGGYPGGGPVLPGQPGYEDETDPPPAPGSDSPPPPSTANETAFFARYGRAPRHEAELTFWVANGYNWDEAAARHAASLNFNVNWAGV